MTKKNKQLHCSSTQCNYLTIYNKRNSTVNKLLYSLYIMMSNLESLFYFI